MQLRPQPLQPALRRAELPLLTGAVGAAGAARSTLELVEHVEECELEAVELLLKCLYRAELSQGCCCCECIA